MILFSTTKKQGQRTLISATLKRETSDAGSYRAPSGSGLSHPSESALDQLDGSVSVAEETQADCVGCATTE
jgi:hypothetical protein